MRNRPKGTARNVPKKYVRILLEHIAAYMFDGVHGDASHWRSQCTLHQIARYGLAELVGAIIRTSALFGDQQT
jgi:hypothetical protein